MPANPVRDLWKYCTYRQRISNSDEHEMLSTSNKDRKSKLRSCADYLFVSDDTNTSHREMDSHICQKQEGSYPIALTWSSTNI